MGRRPGDAGGQRTSKRADGGIDFGSLGRMATTTKDKLVTVTVYVTLGVWVTMNLLGPVYALLTREPPVWEVPVAVHGIPVMILGYLLGRQLKNGNGRNND